ncbi:myotubularin-related protein 12 isoform X2 [Lampris incognitus]|uniref:myotubularin-related protein 12 isoform X2 n=1 Tax=Lampris incognitus TaxID=2546036 RepID=UPI0024B49465|nr:myotubularin-related protein 12 isoform X2 [Lampris incognitus]
MPPQVQLFRNKLYGENDIPLSCVDNIYGVYEDKKKLITGSLVKNRYPSKIIIHSKDLRVFQFVLTFCKEEDAKRIFQGIVHHCLEPKSLKNIFAFSYCGKTHLSGKQGQLRTMMFDSADDWAEDMKRTKGSCQVVTANANFDLSSCLPQFFIVPANVSEVDMSHFQGRGLPIWCWSHHSGCALFKTASLPLLQEDHEQHSYMDKMLTAVAHNYLFSVKTEDLSDTLPTVQDIQLSYNKFKQFFLIDNTTDFWVSDMKWFSLLENCGWLDIIRHCLQKAMEVVECLEKENTNVLILEEGGSDLCCIISSLAQLMLDPFYRTLTGFQSLIQKEWVAGGHRFLDRCNQLHLKDKENVSPVFLLFLECVWQLFQQYGPAFQFSETYLTVLSDSIHVPVFYTFLFNSDYHRASIFRVDSPLSQRHPLNSLTVWDWSVQFNCKSQDLFINPLYAEKPKQDKSVRKSHRSKHQRQLSLPNSAFKTPLKKGFFKDETDSLKKMLRVKRISRWMLSPDSPQPSSMSREFYDAWQRKPLDYHGLLLPCLDGPSVCVWIQRYLRWIHEVQIFGGGSVTILSKVSDLLDEVQELQRKLDRHGCSLVTNHQGTRSKTFKAQSDARSSVHLSSSFPFTTLKNNWPYKPAIPTSLHRLMASGNLENQENDDQDSIV